MRQQHTLMRLDPATGFGSTHPSHAQQWREFNRGEAWLFNPWSGNRRHAADVGSDTFGLRIIPEDEVLRGRA